jgi:hypothetical protein
MIIRVVTIHPDDIIRNGLVFRETTCLSMEPFKRGSQIHIAAFNLPRGVFPNPMLRDRNRVRVALPVVGIRISKGDPPQFVHQFVTGRIGALVIVMRPNGPAVALKGIPCPPLSGFGAPIAPELIRFDADIHVEHGQGFRLQAVGEGIVDLNRRFFSVQQSRCASQCRGCG